MTGYSTQQPEASAQHGGGWQHRYNITQIEREADGGTVTEWQFDYVNTTVAPGARDYYKLMRDITIAAPINGVQVARLEDRENISGTIRKWDALGSPAAIPWIMADNSVALLSKEDLIAIEDAYAQRKAMAFAEYQQRVAEL
jgi:hypothetical protein